MYRPPFPHRRSQRPRRPPQRYSPELSSDDEFESVCSESESEDSESDESEHSSDAEFVVDDGVSISVESEHTEEDEWSTDTENSEDGEDSEDM